MDATSHERGAACAASALTPSWGDLLAMDVSPSRRACSSASGQLGRSELVDDPVDVLLSSRNAFSVWTRPARSASAARRRSPGRGALVAHALEDPDEVRNHQGERLHQLGRGPRILKRDLYISPHADPPLAV